MDKRKLLIAETSEEMAALLADLFRGSCQVKICHSGEKARRLLASFRPDVVILDLMLPDYDGLSLLQWAREQGMAIQVLALTRFCSDYVVETAQTLGVGYLMRKPCSVSALAARVSDLLSREKADSLREPDGGVKTRLMALGVPGKLRGCTYLRHAIPLFARDPLQSVTKVLYPEVARICGCAPSHVERSIRSAIDAAWRRRDDNIWRLYFPCDESGQIPRPTNGDFVARLAQSLENSGGKWEKETEIVQNNPENRDDIRE